MTERPLRRAGSQTNIAEMLEFEPEGLIHMIPSQIIDPELRERVRELTERIEPDARCLLRTDAPAIEFEVEWVFRTYCSCRSCGQWFRQVTSYIAESARTMPQQPTGHTTCTWCNKAMSAEQTVVAGDLRYCVDCTMTPGGDSDRVDVSVDLLRRLRDGVLH